MSSIFDKIKGGASKAADKAHQTLEISRLSSQISATKKDIDKAYMLIGQNVFQAYSNGDLSQANDSIAQHSKQILYHQSSIADIERKIKDVKRE